MQKINFLRIFDSEFGRRLAKKGCFKEIKRVAFCYRDMAYFFLKIKAALPGIHFSPWTAFSQGEAFLKFGKIWRCYFPVTVFSED